jgi:quercetin dioxygenase-like cupin family protein
LLFDGMNRGSDHVRSVSTRRRERAKEADMRRKLTWLLSLTVAIVVTALHVGSVLATQAEGFTSTTLAKGRFGEIAVFNHRIVPSSSQSRNVWLSRQKTKGMSDVYVQSNVWAPGGSSGWHTHPGHSLITVTAGTVTAYEGDDAECKPHVYTPGMGLVDPGGDHVHNLRNEGAVEARTITVQLIPADAARRIDAPDPGHCAF